MNLHVALLPSLLSSGLCDDSFTAIVIDTLRFTTTACQALHRGASAVWIGSEVAEVRELAARQSSATAARVKLCGERLCQPIPGFDLGNSPWEYENADIQAAELFFTTTNGTRAVAAVQNASSIWLSALVNRRATVDRLLAQNPAEVHIVCAGTDGEIALEDVLAAGAIVQQLRQLGPDAVQLHGDAARLAEAAWSAQGTADQNEPPDRTRLLQQFASAAGGRNLIENGFARDLEFAAQWDTIRVVPASSRTEWRRFSRLP